MPCLSLAADDAVTQLTLRNGNGYLSRQVALEHHDQVPAKPPACRIMVAECSQWQ